MILYIIVAAVLLVNVIEGVKFSVSMGKNLL